MTRQLCNKASATAAWRCITIATVSAIALGAWLPSGASADPCIVSGNGGGTVTLPPIGCEYLSPNEVHLIIEGLPAGTTIELAPIHKDFICNENSDTGLQGCPSPGLCEEDPSTGVDCFGSTLQLKMTGTGELAGFSRNIGVQMQCQILTGPRIPGDQTQTFPTEMNICQGAIFGDPDFDVLRVRVGGGLGLPPSLGSTTLQDLGNGTFQVDSFFDIVYEIEYQGALGSVLDGFGGRSQGSVHVEANGPSDNCPLASAFCQSFAFDCVGSGNESCHPNRVRGTSQGAIVEACSCAADGVCGPVQIIMDATGGISSFRCSGDCPIAGELCVIALDGARTGVQALNAIDVGAGQVVTCECPKPAPDPHITIQGTSATFGSADVPAIPADFFFPGSAPFVGAVNLNGGPSDTLGQRSGPIVCPAIGPCAPIQVELIQLDLVSSAPITVVGPGPPLWDVSVDLSPTLSPPGGTPPVGTLQATKTHPNGGTYDSDIPFSPRFTFTETGNPANARVLDYDLAGELPIRINFIGAHWVQQLGPGLVGFVDAPNDGNFVPGVREFNGDPLQQQVVQSTGQSKGGGIGHPVNPVTFCALPDFDPTGLADPCAQLQTSDCIGSPLDTCLPSLAQVTSPQSSAVVECACVPSSPIPICGPIVVDPFNGDISCPGDCPAPDEDPCQLYELDPNGNWRPTGLSNAPADAFPTGTVLKCDCAPPTERCCLPDGTCASMSAADCRLLNGAPGGAGSACAGTDNNNNGRDDACEDDEKCSHCGPGDHWVDSCPAGLDTIPTGAVLGISLDGDCIQDVTVVMGGPATVSRVAGVSHQIIPTEMVAMTLTGEGMTLVAGAGGGVNGNLQPSYGSIIEQNDPAVADSSFNVMFELSGGVLTNPVYNHSPLFIQTSILCLPPNGTYVHPVGMCIPLYDSPIVGQGNIVARLVAASHKTYPGCTSDDDCDGKCQFCDPVSLTCVDLPTDVCCDADDDCDAFATKCRPGVCDFTNNKCTTGPLTPPDCCESDVDCAQFSRKCSPSTCDPDINQCVSTTVPGCCESDQDCGKCEICDTGVNACIPTSAPCCVTDADCPDNGNPCTRESCDPTSNQCISTLICEACCRDDGTCANIAPGTCVSSGGHVVPVCEGDANGNNIDDACEDDKCTNCAPGAHWIDTCPPISPDSDTIPTGALLGIDLDFDCIPDTSVRLQGTTTIAKRGPLDDSTNFPGTRAIDGHLDVVDTEIVWASMTNASGITLEIGSGLGLNPTLGSVAELLVDPTLAESRFDVLARVSGGTLAVPLYNWTPITVLEEINCLPPNGRYIHFGGCTPLYRTPKPTAGEVPVANLVRAIHFTFPDCCLPNSANKSCTCLPLSPNECKDLGGVPANCIGDSDGDGCDDACNPPVEICPDPSPEEWCARFAEDCVPDATDLQFCLPTGFIWDPAVGPRPTGCDCFREGPECGPVNVRRVVDADGNVETYFECKGVCDDGTDNCLVHLTAPGDTQSTNTGLHSLSASAVPPGFEVTCECPSTQTCQPNADRTACEPFVCPNANEICVPTQVITVGVCVGASISCTQDSDCPIACDVHEEVVACDCVSDDVPPTCRWELVAGTTQHECVGVCDDGVEACHVTTVVDADGNTAYKCGCDDPSACVPNATGTACEPFVCPGPLPPLDTCVASCVTVDPLTGVVQITACDCRGLNECRANVDPATGGAVSLAGAVALGTGSDPCVLDDNGSGTVTLPPEGCAYLSPDEVHEIIDGLPAGVTIEFAAIHKDFICERQPGAAPGFCPTDMPPDICEKEGGDLGGNVECGTSTVELTVFINGAAGRSQPHFTTWDSNPHLFYSGPHGGGADTQSFDTEMVALQAVMPAPDALFSSLTIRAGSMFGLPSPGHTTLRRLPSGQFSVDSFFDISYEIDFVGAPGSVLEGAAGTTTGTVRMKTGSVPLCEGACPDDTFDQCVESATVNADGTISMCCECGCPPSTTPTPVPILDSGGGIQDLTANRFLIFEAGDPDRNQAIRVTLRELARPYDVFNGKQMFVGRPGLVSNAGSLIIPDPDFTNFVAAQLQCEPLCRNDWSTLGELHVFHEGIVPSSKYDIEVVDCSCALNDKNNYSAPLSLTTSRMGDILDGLALVPPGPPNTSRDVVDVLGVLLGFSSSPKAPRKARCDLEPNCLDLRINVSDALLALSGFSGLDYSFPAKTTDLCTSPCGNPVP